MPINITSLDSIDPELFSQTFSEVVALLQEKYPQVELTRGPIHDHLQYLAAELAAARQTDILRVTNSQSLLKITEDPTLADDEIVDAVLSNAHITRKPGSPATGSVVLVVDANLPIIIPTSLVLTANGIEFGVDSAFTGRPTGSTITSDTDRELESLGDGRYSFTIGVTAKTTGADGNLARGTKLLLSTTPEHVLTAYAAADFVDGVDTETNESLLARMNLGLASKSVGGRMHLEALIRAQTAFVDTVAYSTVGLGNPEMLRDQHTIFPGSFGGRIDIYSRTRALPVSTTYTLTASLMEKTADGGIWQISIPADQAPGFYEAARIALPTAGPDDPGYDTVLDIRGTNLAAADNPPDIANSAEAAYSRFQTAVIRFLDTDTPVTSLEVGESTQDYQVALSAMPLIAEIQDFISDPQTGYPGADTLVRAPVPCFLSLSFEIHKAAGEDDPDEATIANALASVVNNLGFPGQLHSSILLSRAQDFLSGRQAIGQINMRGRIRVPDGEQLYIASASILEIPDLPTRMVSGRTTAFLLDPRDVGISIVTVPFNT